MKFNLEILPTSLITEYMQQLPEGIADAFDALRDADISTESFSFYTSVASVFSSKIEGENIEMDSYMKYKWLKVKYLPDYTKKIDDLYNAYIFAQNNPLNHQSFSNAHQILTKNILPKHQQGKFRTGNMYVATQDGRIEYIAVSPYKVKEEMEKLDRDINLLLESNLRLEEVFFFAALIHLVFVKIHPFNDGNGRSGRLLEKWFIAEKLGKKAWFLSSERNYYDYHAVYYQNLRCLGLEYDFLDYTQALPFLLMLPKSLL